MSDGKLFVGGISWETTDEVLRQYFAKYGDIVDCIVMREPLTGRSRGFGFVTFTDPASCDKVLQEKHVLDGKPIDPKRAVPRDKIQNAPRNDPYGGGYSTGGGGGGQVGQNGELRTRKIFVGGISQSTTEETLRAYFSQYGKVEETTVMVDKETRRPRGFAFVSFDSEDAVERVVEKKMHEIDNKPNVEVKKAEPKGYRPNVIPMPVRNDYQSAFAVPYSLEESYDGGYEGGYRPVPTSYGVPYGSTSYDGFATSSLYTAGPGSLGGYASTGGGRTSSAIAVPYTPGGYGAAYAYPTSPVVAPLAAIPARSPAPYGAIGAALSSGYQDPYYGSAGASDLDYAQTGEDIYGDYEDPTSPDGYPDAGFTTNTTSTNVSHQQQQQQQQQHQASYGGPLSAQGRPSSRYQPYSRNNSS